MVRNSQEWSRFFQAWLLGIRWLLVSFQDWCSGTGAQAGAGCGAHTVLGTKTKVLLPRQSSKPYLEHKSLGMVGPQVRSRLILGHRRTWHPGSEVPMPGSSPIELPAQVPGYGSQVHKVAEATSGTLPKDRGGHHD